MSGKGSRPRPVDTERFRLNYDRIDWARPDGVPKVSPSEDIRRGNALFSREADCLCNEGRNTRTLSGDSVSPLGEKGIL